MPELAREAGNQREHQRHAQANHHGAPHYDGGVDGGKAVDEALVGGLLRLGALHHGHDAREHRAILVSRDLKLHHARGVERASEDLGAHALVLGRALAGDGGLVEGRAALQNHAVQRHALARQHADALAFLHVLHGHVVHVRVGALAVH